MGTGDVQVNENNTKPNYIFYLLNIFINTYIIKYSKSYVKEYNFNPYSELSTNIITGPPLHSEVAPASPFKIEGQEPRASLSSLYSDIRTSPEYLYRVIAKGINYT